MGREEGGGFRMGNMCIPVADSFLYMAEPINIVKFKNKIKLKKKKKETNHHKRSSMFLFSPSEIFVIFFMTFEMNSLSSLPRSLVKLLPGAGSQGDKTLGT